MGVHADVSLLDLESPSEQGGTSRNRGGSGKGEQKAGLPLTWESVPFMQLCVSPAPSPASGELVASLLRMRCHPLPADVSSVPICFCRAVLHAVVSDENPPRGPEPWAAQPRGADFLRRPSFLHCFPATHLIFAVSSSP